MSAITVKDMVEAGVHYGHKTRKWHPAMKEYIYGTREGIHIIDARISLQKLKETYDFVSNLASKGGKVLFVGTKTQAQSVMKEQAERCGCYYISNRWLGGTMTNFATIRQSISKLSHFDQLAGEDNTYPGILKKEAVRYERLRKKMLRNLAGIREMRKHPATLFVVDIRYEDIAIQEAKSLGIPVIAIVDTNANPNLIDYPIPGNDDSVTTIDLYASVVASAHIVGRQIYERQVAIEAKEKEEKAAEKIAKASAKAKKEEKLPISVEPPKTPEIPPAKEKSEE